MVVGSSAAVGLSELRTRASYLAKLLGWVEEDVVWLLFTREAPYLNPLKVGLSYSRRKPATVTLITSFYGNDRESRRVCD
jgi:hypothetical protein